MLLGVLSVVILGISSTLWDDEVRYAGAELLGYVSLGISMVLVFLGIRNFYKQEDEHPKFWKAFQIGLGITIVGSLIYASGWLIMVNVNPELPNKMWEMALIELEESDLSSKELQAEKQELQDWKEMYQNPVNMFFITTLEMLPVGVIASIISALILWLPVRKFT